MSMNWDDLRIFLSVARNGSLSAAARALRISQPTVGRRLKALEDSLGARLFDRLPEGFAPTSAGTELLPLAEEMERAALALDRRQAALADGVRGTVRLSIYEVMAQFLLDHLATLRRNLPEIEIELAVAHISANLSRREADLSLRECLPDAPGLIARRLGEIAYAIYGARDYVAANPAALGEARYRDCAWVSTDEEHNYFAGQKWLLDRVGDRRPMVRVNNGIVLYEAVRKGVGLGILPCFAADADGGLVRLSPPLGEVSSVQHMIVHHDLRRVPSVRAVMDELARLFRREAPRLRGEAGTETLSA